MFDEIQRNLSPSNGQTEKSILTPVLKDLEGITESMGTFISMLKYSHFG